METPKLDTAVQQYNIPRNIELAFIVSAHFGENVEISFI